MSRWGPHSTPDSVSDYICPCILCISFRLFGSYLFLFLISNTSNIRNIAHILLPLVTWKPLLSKYCEDWHESSVFVGSINFTSLLLYLVLLRMRIRIDCKQIILFYILAFYPFSLSVKIENKLYDLFADKEKVNKEERIIQFPGAIRNSSCLHFLIKRGKW